MDNGMWLTILLVAIGFIGSLIGIIYTNLNKKTQDNADDIEKIKETYATKAEVKENKDDQNKYIERVEKKLDKIYHILVESKNEK